MFVEANSKFLSQIVPRFLEIMMIFYELQSSILNQLQQNYYYNLQLHDYEFACFNIFIISPLKSFHMVLKILPYLSCFKHSPLTNLSHLIFIKFQNLHLFMLVLARENHSLVYYVAFNDYNLTLQNH
jgi:hypothetical protein